MKNCINIYNSFFPREYKKKYGLNNIKIISGLFILVITAFILAPGYVDIALISAIFAFEYMYSFTRLNGILNKNATQNDYIRTAPNGLKIIKTVICMDLAIHSLMVLLLMTIFSIDVTHKILILDILALSLLIIIISQLAKFISYYIVRTEKLIVLLIVTIMFIFLPLFMYI